MERRGGGRGWRGKFQAWGLVVFLESNAEEEEEVEGNQVQRKFASGDRKLAILFDTNCGAASEF